MSDAPLDFGSTPVAEVRDLDAPSNRASGASGWLSFGWIPLLAIVLAAFLGRSACGARGEEVNIRFRDGYGIKAGDTLRHRGIGVGEVTSVELEPGLEAVRCKVELNSGAEALARTGSRFWVMRPHVSLDGVSGLETVVGARYLAVVPGPPEAERETEFIGLEEPPILDQIEPGGLELVLNAPRRFGLIPGAPLYYRQIQVGSATSVQLSSDATSVEVRVHVQPPYVPLVRSNSRFWQVSGIDMKLALTEGFSFELESARTLITGGIAMATPNDPGDLVKNGRVYLLRETYDEDWLEWRPAIPIGNSLLPDGASLPRPQRAILRWREGRFLRSGEERGGNLMLTKRGWIAPRNLVSIPSDSETGSTSLEVAGEELSIDTNLVMVGEGQVVLLTPPPIDLPQREAWPEDRIRLNAEPEDCLIVADGLAPQALSAARFQVIDQDWQVEKKVNFDNYWHGACVLARSDGAWIGTLCINRGIGKVVLLNSELLP